MDLTDAEIQKYFSIPSEWVDRIHRQKGIDISFPLRDQWMIIKFRPASIEFCHEESYGTFFGGTGYTENPLILFVEHELPRKTDWLEFARNEILEMSDRLLKACKEDNLLPEKPFQVKNSRKIEDGLILDFFRVPVDDIEYVRRTRSTNVYFPLFKKRDCWFIVEFKESSISLILKDQDDCGGYTWESVHSTYTATSYPSVPADRGQRVAFARERVKEFAHSLRKHIVIPD